MYFTKFAFIIILVFEDIFIHSEFFFYFRIKHGKEDTSFLEEILLVTTSSSGPTCPSPCIFLPNDLELNKDNVGSILFERLLFDIETAEVRWPTKLSRRDKSLVELTKRSEVISYLIEVYERCWKHRNNQYSSLSQLVSETVITNLATALEQPELYPNQQPLKQFQDAVFSHLSSASFENLLNCYLKHIENEKMEVPPVFKMVNFTNMFKLLLIYRIFIDINYAYFYSNFNFFSDC